MKRNPVSCNANHSIEECLSVMQKNQIRRLPVVDEHNRCIGIIAQADIALHLDAEAVSSTVAEISRPTPSGTRKAA
jgi:predicted transcriptional regulator